MTNEVRGAFSKRLRDLMFVRRLDARGLAERSGVSVWSIQDYLAGRATPGFDTAYALALALRCTPNDLCAFPGTDPPEELKHLYAALA